MLKKLFGEKYKMKNLGKVKTIIGQQITKDLVTSNMKIDQSTFIKNFIIERERINCNANVIPIKTRSAIKMTS